MDLDLTPKSAQALFEGEGGAYYSWLSSDFPILAEGKVGGGRLVLQPRGFALPHYADSSKLGYVLQGNDGVVGMVLPNKSKEVVLKLKKGDVIPVPVGTTSWWFNEGDYKLDIVFLGETSKAHIPGNFTYFFLTGALSILGGFSTKFISKAFDMSNDEANKLVKSQQGVLIIKLDEKVTLPKPHQNDISKELVYNLEAAHPDYCVKDGGLWTRVTEGKFPFLGKVGLSSNLIKLEANALSSPIYTNDSSVHVIYVVNGSGEIQIVGMNGKLVLDAKVKAGDLLVVPKFFVVALLAGEEEMECFSVITNSEPALEDLASKESVFEALSPEVLQASFNITADFEELFVSKIRKSSIILSSNK
ncbi:hypothetical protein UlMin_041473 [Ulmus minor]